MQRCARRDWAEHRQATWALLLIHAWILSQSDNSAHCQLSCHYALGDLLRNRCAMVERKQVLGMISKNHHQHRYYNFHTY